MKYFVSLISVFLSLPAFSLNSNSCSPELVTAIAQDTLDRAQLAGDEEKRVLASGLIKIRQACRAADTRTENVPPNGTKCTVYMSGTGYIHLRSKIQGEDYESSYGVIYNFSKVESLGELGVEGENTYIKVRLINNYEVTGASAANGQIGWVYKPYVGCGG